MVYIDCFEKDFFLFNVAFHWGYTILLHSITHRFVTWHRNFRLNIFVSVRKCYLRIGITFSFNVCGNCGMNVNAEKTQRWGRKTCLTLQVRNLLKLRIRIFFVTLVNGKGVWPMTVGIKWITFVRWGKNHLTSLDNNNEKLLPICKNKNNENAKFIFSFMKKCTIIHKYFRYNLMAKNKIKIYSVVYRRKAVLLNGVFSVHKCNACTKNITLQAHWPLFCYFKIQCGWVKIFILASFVFEALMNFISFNNNKIREII